MVCVACVATLLMCLGACRQECCADVDEIDSLNALSYGLRYTSASESMRYADEVIERFGASGYRDGVHLAWLNKANAHYMLMRYDSVRVCCEKVMSESRNDLLVALADVQMMQTCNMLALSKDFYTYRKDAQDKFKRLMEESEGMTERQRRMCNSTMAQFHIASLHYFVRMRLSDEVNESVEWLEENADNYADDATLVAGHLMLKSMLRLPSGDPNVDIVTQQRRVLADMLQISTEYGYTYIVAEALHRIARSMVSSGDLRPAMRTYLADYLGVEDDEWLGEAIDLRALELFEQYGNRYTISRALITLSDFKLDRGHPEEALPLLESALEMVNEHHREINQTHHIDRAGGVVVDTLYAFSSQPDSISTEMLWIDSLDILTVPVWMSIIREQLSVVYGAMGMKAESDYNHNIYFDILDATRQDQRVMQEGENLSREERMLNLLIVVFVIALVLMAWALFRFNKRSAAQYHERVGNLSEVITVCKNMTTALSEETEDEDELVEALHRVTDSDVRRLFPTIAASGCDDWTTVNPATMRGMEREMYNVLLVCYEWVKDKGLMFIGFANEARKLESERYAIEKKYEESKKQYIEKLTSMSIVHGITPFLDRALREVDKMKHETDRDKTTERLKYVSELIDKINEYNDVLGHWVKIRQGVVTLNVENFALQPLLDTMKLSSKAFAARGITLDVGDCAEVVKADKSLTLFMMNTLLDNARKYTPEGGRVTLESRSMDDCVEIAVHDNGHGMSAEDVETINGSKVYDSSRIGADSEAVKAQKGFGFGLMNCKGIIEKYRKTNVVFAVCQFGVESEQGRGSRFFFRLPKGAMRTLTVAVLMAMSAMLTACHNSDAEEMEYDDEMEMADAEDAPAWQDDELMLQAEYYADCQFSANVEGDYEASIEYADSALCMLNAYYLKMVPDGDKLMNLAAGPVAEQDWWREGFDTDYSLIISIRNEVAIAALALNRNQLYHYNSDSFKRLYILANTDHTLEKYCNDTREANKNRKAIATMLGLTIVVVLLVYFFLHYRRYQLFVFNLRQFIALNKRMFVTACEDLPDVLLRGISDIKFADAVQLRLTDGATEQILTAQGAKEASDTDKMEQYALTISTADREVNVGTMEVLFHDTHLTDDESLIIDLVREFVAIHTYFSRQRVSEHNEAIEIKEDERRRIEMEQQRVHVQNMIMDNCMSALKHETMYYPNRIKQITDAALADAAAGGKGELRLADIDELLTYYKQVFNILSACAGKQVEKMLFKRSTVTAAFVGELARKAHKRAAAKDRSMGMMREATEGRNIKAMVDKTFMQVLIANIVSLYQEHHSGGDLVLEYGETVGFVQFTFTDTAYRLSDDDIPNMFYVDNVKYDPQADRLEGMQYLIIKQIIREHDKYSTHRGCRVYVENAPDGCGSRFVFTLQKA